MGGNRMSTRWKTGGRETTGGERAAPAHETTEENRNDGRKGP